jgi:hypothetical protein
MAAVTYRARTYASGHPAEATRTTFPTPQVPVHPLQHEGHFLGLEGDHLERVTRRAKGSGGPAGERNGNCKSGLF